MTAMILTVKGDPETARHAAESHGFKVRTSRSVAHGSQSVLTAEGDFEVAVHWFCEPSVAVRGEGFPAGTLLLYR